MLTSKSFTLDCVGIVHAGDNGTPGRAFEASDLGQLPFLTAVVKEGLRLLPPTPLGGVRVCTEDDTILCGFKVPKVGRVIKLFTTINL
jgi:cytochrome P450